MPPRAPNPTPIPPPRGLAGEDLTRWVIKTATGTFGFALAGVCPAAPASREKELRDWLAAGKHGEMSFLLDQFDHRLDPARELPEARSMILVADLYAERGEARQPEPIEASGRIARYAQGRDYHEVVRRRLHELADALRAAHPESRTRAFVDTAPVLEREHAMRAGLGWVGKHTLLIRPRIGSRFVLGGILTSLDLPPLPDHEPVADACGTCTRCIDACPTGAITPYSVDATRCISYLTIEHRSPIDESLAAKMGDWLFGCDVCQDVCPHNSPRPSQASVPSSPALAPIRSHVPLLDLLQWTQRDRSALGVSAMKRATLAMLKRNALIAMANHVRAGHPSAAKLHARIAQATTDAHEDPLVRETAATLLTTLSRPAGEGQP